MRKAIYPSQREIGKYYGRGKVGNKFVGFRGVFRGHQMALI